MKIYLYLSIILCSVLMQAFEPIEQAIIEKDIPELRELLKERNNTLSNKEKELYLALARGMVDLMEEKSTKPWYSLLGKWFMKESLLNKIIVTGIPLSHLIIYTPGIILALRGQDATPRKTILINVLNIAVSFSYGAANFYLYRKFRRERYQSFKSKAQQILKILGKTQVQEAQ